MKGEGIASLTQPRRSKPGEQTRNAREGEGMDLEEKIGFRQEEECQRISEAMATYSYRGDIENVALGNVNRLVAEIETLREAHERTKAELLGFQKQSIEQQELVDHLKAEIEKVRKTRRDLIAELERVTAQRDELVPFAKQHLNAISQTAFIKGLESSDDKEWADKMKQECIDCEQALAACEKEDGDE